MIITRSMHDEWLSNAYLVADEPGGTAIFLDAGAPVEPLVAKVEELGLTVTHIMLTHEHPDHIEHADALAMAYGAAMVRAGDVEDGYRLRTGGLELEAIATPGHCHPHFAWLVNGTDVFTGDALFAGTVGGTMHGGPDGLEFLRRSVMDRLMSLPHDIAVHPGHTDATSIGREWEENPFIRLWRGLDEPGDEPVDVLGTPGTALLRAPDYDGGSKVLVRLVDGMEAIVGGSRVAARGAATAAHGGGGSTLGSRGGAAGGADA